MKSGIVKLLHRVFFVVSVLFFFESCCIQKRNTNGGSVLQKRRLYDYSKKNFELPPYNKDRKLWYKDSLIIAELFRIDIEEDNNGHETWKAVIYGYTFIDLRTKSFYDYTTFSDTARIVDKYTQPDTGRVKGGWNFFDNRPVIYPENLETLPDTVIENISYKRVKSSRVFKTGQVDENVFQVGYFRYDKKNSFFFLDKPLSKQIGYPMVRVDHLTPSRQTWIMTEIEFLPDQLTKEEIKVFDAWQKNAKNNPVHK